MVSPRSDEETLSRKVARKCDEQIGNMRRCGRVAHEHQYVDVRSRVIAQDDITQDETQTQLMNRTYQAVVLVKHSTPISCFIQCLEVELADIFLTRGISMLVFKLSAKSVYTTP